MQCPQILEIIEEMKPHFQVQREVYENDTIGLCNFSYSDVKRIYALILIFFFKSFIFNYLC